MTSDKIQIGVACGDNCEHYVNFLINSIMKSSINAERIEFILGINKKSVNVELLKRNDVATKMIKCFSNGITSLEHGKCLDSIFGNMDSKYGMFVDCDVAFLYKGWDVLFESMINENTVIIGPEYDGNKYMNFPNIVGCFFLTDVLKELKISLKPDKTIKIDKHNALIYNRKIGDEIFLDVGWELCYKLRKSGYSGIALPLARTMNSSGSVVTSVSPKFIQSDMRGEEYQLNGNPILTHVGRSSTRDFNTDPIVIRWRSEVEKWLAK